MNELAVSTSNILNSIEPALTKLSETFCVSVDYLKENVMQYIMMYGKYELMTGIFNTIIWMSILSGVIIGFAVLIGWFIYEEYSDYNSEPYNWKKIIKISSKIAIFFILMLIVFQLVIYVSSPEIYSIKQVLELIQSMR